MENARIGDPVSGKLCYFIAARLYPDFAQIPFSSGIAVYPLLINNQTDRELSIDRICLHTEFGHETEMMLPLFLEVLVAVPDGPEMRVAAGSRSLVKGLAVAGIAALGLRVDCLCASA